MGEPMLGFMANIRPHITGIITTHRLTRIDTIIGIESTIGIRGIGKDTLIAINIVTTIGMIGVITIDELTQELMISLSFPAF